MPEIERDGLNSLEYVISWQHILVPPILFIVYNCLSVEYWSGPSLPQMAEGYELEHMSSVIVSYDFRKRLLVHNIN